MKDTNMGMRADERARVQLIVAGRTRLPRWTAQQATAEFSEQDGNVEEHMRGNDLIVGGAGNDVLVGQGGDDELYGGTEDDWIWGDDVDAEDTPVAIHGDDYLDGGDGADQLVGGGKDDVLFGSAGNVNTDEFGTGQKPWSAAAGLHSRPGADVDIAIEDQWLSDEPNPTISTRNRRQMVMTDPLSDFALLSKLDPPPSAANSLSFRSAA